MLIEKDYITETIIIIFFNYHIVIFICKGYPIIYRMKKYYEFKFFVCNSEFKEFKEIPSKIEYIEY